MMVSESKRRAAPLVLGIIVGGCATSSPPRSSFAPGLAPESPEAPALERGPWHAPRPEPRAPGGLAWTEAPIPSPCSTRSGVAPIVQIDNEAEFSAMFCRSSDVDWKKFRILSYRGGLFSGQTFVTSDVVRDAQDINWLLQPLPCASSDTPLLGASILIERSTLPVVARIKPDSGVICPPNGDGYGY